MLERGRHKDAEHLAAALLVLVLSAAPSGCGGLFQGRELAQAEVAAMHERFNGRDFAGIYASTSQGFRRETSPEEFRRTLTTLRDRLGAVIATQTTHSRVQIRNFESHVLLIQQTKYVRGRARESFAFVIRDGEARLDGYEIDSTRDGANQGLV